MKVSLDWLRDFVPVSLAPAELAARLSLAGLAVEGIAGDGTPGNSPAAGDSAVVLDLDITSNRPDCLSHYGVAREIAALTSAPLRSLRDSQPALTESGGAAGLAVRVTIEAPAACGRYCARVLENVTVAASPAPIAARLNRLGHRAINNIADLTNYTLWEMGQPTHAFDLDTLRGPQLRVRFARPGETLITLDEVERRLDPADLVIADAERPVALAGVMGGLASAISAQTRRVVLESAWFDPLTVRRMARRHGLHTDASHRFERGADPGAAPLAAHRIAARAQAYGATVLPGLIDERGTLPTRAPILLRSAQLERLLGSPVPPDRVEAILLALGLQPQLGAWMPPTWRPDLGREIDLIEEVARIHGLDQFPARLPAFAGVARDLPDNPLRDRVRLQMRARGFAEAVTISFADAAECHAFAPATSPVRVLNPLSEEAAILRTSPLPAMLHLLAHNRNRGAESARLFEIGKIYSRTGAATAETPVLCLGWAGGGDLLAIKAEIVALLDAFELPPIDYRAPAPAYLHPGRSALVSVAGQPIGAFGQLHPDVATAWKLAPDTLVAELHLAPLYLAGPRQVRYIPPSRFPASARDFSFLFADTVTWATIAQAVRPAPAAPATPAAAAAPDAALREVLPVEIFRGPQLPPGHYSLLLRARWQRDDRTLRDDEVQAGADAITAHLRALGGQQR